MVSTVAEGGALDPVTGKDGPSKDAKDIPSEVDEGSVGIPEGEPPVAV